MSDEMTMIDLLYGLHGSASFPGHLTDSEFHDASVSGILISQASGSNEKIARCMRGALAHHLQEALRPLALELARLQRLEKAQEQEKGRLNLARFNQQMRTLLMANPSARAGASPSRFLLSRQPNKGWNEETRLEVRPAWHASDFVVLNRRTGTFRAWSARLYRPFGTPVVAAGDLPLGLINMKLPARTWPTILLRACLASDQKVRARSAIEVGRGHSISWTDDLESHPLALPQQYVLTAIRYLGLKCGVSVRRVGKTRLEVAWNGTVFKYRDLISPLDWIDDPTKANEQRRKKRQEQRDAAQR